MKQCGVEGEASTKVKDIKIVISLKSRKVGKKKYMRIKKRKINQEQRTSYLSLWQNQN